MYKGSTFKQCISRHEDYLALKLGLKPGMICLDVGCGVGGPQREIARFSQAHIVGLNNNEYQVERCNYLAGKYGLSNRVNTVKVDRINKGDFEEMPFAENTFDACYAVEATVHARHLENPYSQVFKALKPGALFACYEWLTTSKYDESNLDQKRIIFNLEEGNSIPKLYTIPQCLNALESVGFEVLEYCDLADEDNYQAEQDPWYTTLQGSLFPGLDQLNRLQMHPIGRAYYILIIDLPRLHFMRLRLYESFQKALIVFLKF